MITTYEFPNQWNWRLFLAITSEQEELNEILTYLNDREKCSFTLYEDCNVNPPCFAHEPDSLEGVICLDSFTYTPKDIMFCVHELTHLMISISERNDCPINIDTTECWAYFMGNMIQMILEILQSYLEDQKPKRKVRKSSSKRKLINE